ncbi:ethanolamine ammonia-lyase subunit EutC [Marinobacter sp. ST-43]|jgi:ethanolamine ammonia-lyase small subunit|uniref:ethanolamine ammonia-lyase subunit EutC n=1 Tax=Marinobacter sp. ST-43 TaxID=3050453 RepID=UPI0026E075ED|nr:ethanolamine ammonia-lyase subunit EutC [Marinobacter sp. ST-43]
MTNSKFPTVVHNPWRGLRQYTPARIGLGRAGVSLPTAELLEFQLAHARARDAVHHPLDIEQLIIEFQQIPEMSALGPPIQLQSQAPDRACYLQRPDLGRVLSESSSSRLQSSKTGSAEPPDLAIVIADGLSARAVQQNAPAFMRSFLRKLAHDGPEWRVAAPLLVEQGRVAIGDHIGQVLQTQQVVVLIGERPGLSSPDSLGVYLTHHPEPGLPDARRNCVSNIRPAGLGVEQASEKVIYLLKEARQLGTSGVALKDRSEEVELTVSERGNFLV